MALLRLRHGMRITHLTRAAYETGNIAFKENGIFKRRCCALSRPIATCMRLGTAAGLGEPCGIRDVPGSPDSSGLCMFSAKLGLEMGLEYLELESVVKLKDEKKSKGRDSESQVRSTGEKVIEGLHPRIATLIQHEDAKAGLSHFGSSIPCREKQSSFEVTSGLNSAHWSISEGSPYYHKTRLFPKFWCCVACCLETIPRHRTDRPTEIQTE